MAGLPSAGGKKRNPSTYYFGSSLPRIRPPRRRIRFHNTLNGRIICLLNPKTSAWEVTALLKKMTSKPGTKQ